MLFVQFFCHEFQFGIPVFAEFAYQRLFQKLVDGQVFFFPEQHGCLAYIPSVEVDGFERAAVVDPDGVEVA